MIPGVILVCTSILAVWRPVETYPLTGLVLAVAFVVLIPWAWQRTSASGARRSAVCTTLWLVFLIAGQAGGWDRSEAITQAFLAGAVMAAIWVASRHAPDDWMIDIFALGLIGLAIWGLWQSFGGLHDLRPLTESLPEHLRAGVLARIDRGRAFASLLLPSHLAVVLATVLPILMVRINRDARGILFGLAFTLGLAGLVATRSPVGVILALGSCALVLARPSHQWSTAARNTQQSSPFSIFRSINVPSSTPHSLNLRKPRISPRLSHLVTKTGEKGGPAASRRKYLYWALGLGCAAITVVVAFRPDVLRLKPLLLRLDNWGAALWVWSTAPVSGVGLGGFGQAAQSVPWPVGNHPVHAHSMPLEMFADLGVFGLGLWFAAMAWILSVAKRLWPRRPDLAVALLVIPAHNLVDFSLYTSAVALPWAILLGWSLALTREGGEAEVAVSPGLRWIPVLGGAAAAAVTLLVFTGFTLKEAARGEGPFESRFEWARSAALLTPWDADATGLVGVLALESHDRETARQSLSFLDSRNWQRPRSAARAQLMGRLNAMAGDPVVGLTNLWRAQENQPYEWRRQKDFEVAAEELDRRRAGR